MFALARRACSRKQLLQRQFSPECLKGRRVRLARAGNDTERNTASSGIGVSSDPQSRKAIASGLPSNADMVILLSVVLRAIMDISAPAISLADRPHVGPLGSPVFACAGKTEPPSRLIFSQTLADK